MPGVTGGGPSGNESQRWSGSGPKSTGCRLADAGGEPCPRDAQEVDPGAPMTSTVPKSPVSRPPREGQVNLTDQRKLRSRLAHSRAFLLQRIIQLPQDLPQDHHGYESRNASAEQVRCNADPDCNVFAVADQCQGSSEGTVTDQRIIGMRHCWPLKKRISSAAWLKVATAGCSLGSEGGEACFCSIGS